MAQILNNFCTRDKCRTSEGSPLIIGLTIFIGLRSHLFLSLSPLRELKLQYLEFGPKSSHLSSLIINKIKKCNYKLLRHYSCEQYDITMLFFHHRPTYGIDCLRHPKAMAIILPLVGNLFTYALNHYNKESYYNY